MQIKIGLFGGDGKMGQAVEQAIPLMKGNDQPVPYLYVGEKKSSLFQQQKKKLADFDSKLIKAVDVWIDFSSPEGLRQLIKTTAKDNSAIVSGTTGLSAADFESLKKQSRNKKIFWASNMSPGLWVFRQMMKGLQAASQFDFAIEETHHTQKKDKPSGTAKTIHQDLEKVINKKIAPPVSFRLGGVFGVHAIHAASSNEVITLQHQALNRTVFAEGALMAANWIAKHVEESGLYSMDEMMIQLNQNERRKK